VGDERRVHHIVVILSFEFQHLNKKDDGLFLEVSTLARVRTLQEAKYFKKMGANRITPDREIMRDTKLLTNMSKVLPLKIMVNEGCLKDCIAKYAHYNFLSREI